MKKKTLFIIGGVVLALVAIAVLLKGKFSTDASPALGTTQTLSANTALGNTVNAISGLLGTLLNVFTTVKGAKTTSTAKPAVAAQDPNSGNFASEEWWS